MITEASAAAASMRVRSDRLDSRSAIEPDTSTNTMVRPFEPLLFVDHRQQRAVDPAIKHGCCPRRRHEPERQHPLGSLAIRERAASPASRSTPASAMLRRFRSNAR